MLECLAKIFRWLNMRKPIVSTILILISVCTVSYIFFCYPNISIIEIGTFIVLAITLVVLIFYAYDTNRLATISQLRWERENILKTNYYMEGTNDKGGAGIILFGINNSSTLLMRAKVRCNFKVYNVLVEDDDAFNGIETWYIFPQQTTQGSYIIEQLLKKRGKTVENMCQEYTDGNRGQQLTMDLEIEFRDESGNERKLPSRKHYFAFNDWRWIPLITKRDEWI